MEAESQKYNNPEHYAKYGKMQRQIMKKSKELKNLEAAAKEAEKDAPKTPVIMPERPAMPEKQPSKPFTAMLPKARTAAFVLTTLFFYILPLGFASWFLEMDYIFTHVNPSELGFLAEWIGVPIDYHGHLHTFFTFRTVYMLCLAFAGSLVTLIIDVKKELK